jgi:large subunit ribosomal protein L6
MSRIGKMPITIPAGVEIKFDKGQVTVKGKKGQLIQDIDKDIIVKIEGTELTVERPTEQKRHKAMHGLYRSLINNMVIGVSEGYVRKLEMIGVGYRCSNQGNLLEVAVGFSHPVVFVIPAEIKVTTAMEKGSPPTITLESHDLQLLGQVAARIQKIRKPEPYKGKGIKFQGQEIRRKAGKAGAKK